MCPRCHNLSVGYITGIDNSRFDRSKIVDNPDYGYLNPYPFVPLCRMYSCFNPQCGHQWTDPAPLEKEKAPKKT